MVLGYSRVAADMLRGNTETRDWRVVACAHSNAHGVGADIAMESSTLTPRAFRRIVTIVTDEIYISKREICWNGDGFA